MDSSPLKLTITPPPNPLPAEAPARDNNFWGEDGLTFGDILDIVNPFQQVPVVSTLYRENTGAGISTASRLIGGALIGGPIGFLLAIANSIIEETSGKDVGGHIFAMFQENDGTETQVASNDVPPSRVYAKGSLEAYLKAQSLLG